MPRLARLRLAILVLACQPALQGCASLVEGLDGLTSDAVALSREDEQTGSSQLATATKQNVDELVPPGSTRAQVRQKLGAPELTIADSVGPGTQTESYTYRRTSYKRNVMQQRMLYVVYDADGRVKHNVFTAEDQAIR